jgi:hypothetical protein
MIRLFGLLCSALAVFLGLFALFDYLMSQDNAGRVVAVVLGWVALLLLLFGLRALWRRGRLDSAA